MSELRQPVNAEKIINNPTYEELEKMCAEYARKTKYGSLCFISNVRSRSAKYTYIVENSITLGIDQKGISRERAVELANQVHNYLKEKEVIQLDRRMGLHEEFSLHCRLYITSDYARIPLKWHNMLFPVDDIDKTPDLLTVFVPEWPERIIFYDPYEHVTYVLGSDYFGECKKSFLRMSMYWFKTQKAGLGFHAGSKVLRVNEGNNSLKERGFLLFGLSGTGKTTLTMHNHGLKEPERAVIRQDDVVMMTRSGYCYGTENGFYIKTEGLDENQKVLYDAATSPHAVYENVMVDEEGNLLFDNFELTSNGRGVIRRCDVEGVDERIDLDRAHKLIFITRNEKIVPPVARLTPAQSAAFFMLGESVETSAGDPSKAGQSKRVVGTNPFIVGPEYEEGNLLYDILQNNPYVECFLFNTGSIGLNGDKPGKKISIDISTEILKHLALEDIEWKEDTDWGYEVPVGVPGIDISMYEPHEYYSKEKYKQLIEELRRERKEWLNKYSKGLNKEIIEAI